jgi:hypothetical protein
LYFSIQKQPVLTNLIDYVQCIKELQRIQFQLGDALVGQVV